MTVLKNILKTCCICLTLDKASWSPNNTVLMVKKQKSKVFEKFSKYDINKPEWLKQWTISKGWMHDRSHMLSLGLENNSESNTNIDKQIQIREEETSSVSNASDLISIIENFDNTVNNDRNNHNETREIQTTDLDLEKIEKVENSNLFENININYRKNFPIFTGENFKKLVENDTQLHTKHSSKSELSSGQFYFFNLCQQIDTHNSVEENLKTAEAHSDNTLQYKIKENAIPSRQSLFHKSNHQVESIKTNEELKTTERRTSRLNSNNYFPKNIDTIYECSEDSLSVYTNPIYEPTQALNGDVQILNGASNIKEYYDFNKETNCKYQKYLSKQLNTNNLTNTNSLHFFAKKSKYSKEKYIIRHIRIRIMLSLKLRKFQRIHRKQLKNNSSVLFCFGKRKKPPYDERSSYYKNLIRSDILKIHEEQTRINNGNTTLKIQNLR